MKIAIIGAGLAGLSAARALADASHAVTVFEKARGVGGRLAQRRMDAAAWDLGAQYFTTRGGGSLAPGVDSNSGPEPTFEAQLQRWLAEGAAAPWPLRLATRRDAQLAPVRDGITRYVGTPGMNALAKSLLGGFELRLATRVCPWSPQRGGLHSLHDEHGAALGEFEAVLVTSPAEQAAELLAAFPQASGIAAQVRLSPCLALSIKLPEALDLPFDALFADGKVLSWLAREDSKPARPALNCWTAHAAPEWSQQHLEEPVESLVELLSAAFFEQLDVAPQVPLLARVHRWRYAIAEPALDCGAWFDPESRIGLAGDWLAGNRVAGAWRSGRAAAALVV